MLKNLNLANVLVLDIETVSGKRRYEDLDEVMRGLWDLKSEQLQRREENKVDHAQFYERAGIYAEFGKIVCISVGVFTEDKTTKEWVFRVKSYYNHDERQLLMEFSAMIQRHYGNPNSSILCGHNIKEFDIPYICRRMIINAIPLPDTLDLAGKKPWDAKWLLDTMDLWKFGDYKSATALKVLCGVFGIPTPKDDIDGSEVGKTYWEDDDLDRIQRYCQKDVVATAQVLLRFQLLPLIKPENIHHV